MYYNAASMLQHPTGVTNAADLAEFRNKTAFRNKVINRVIITLIICLNLFCVGCLLKGGALPNNIQATKATDPNRKFRLAAIGVNDLFALLGVVFLVIMARSIDKI